MHQAGFEFSPEIEKKIIEQGEKLIAISRRNAELDQSQDSWLERFLNRIMEDDEFRIQALRFVDVMPQLDDNRDLVKHLDEYFGEEDLPLTGILKFGVRYARSGLGGTLLAQSVRKVIKTLALQFMGGATATNAIAAARKLYDENISFSIDLLGEAVVSEKEADEYREEYLNLFRTLPDQLSSWPAPQNDYTPTPQLNVSLKLSSLYSQISPLDPEGSIKGITRRLRPLLVAARQANAFVLIDMEQYDYKAIIIDCFKTLMMEEEFRDWPDVGLAMQAYLRDTEEDLQQLIEWTESRGTPITVRLVRGAYWDYETIITKQQGWSTPVWSEKRRTDACYERCLDLLFKNTQLIRPAVATHNMRSMALAMVLAEQNKVTPRDFEFQMLYGMARSTEQAIPEAGYVLRIYTPFGDLLPGMAYLVRRLLENSSSQSVKRMKITSAPAVLAEPTNNIDQTTPGSAPPSHQEQEASLELLSSPHCLADGIDAGNDLDDKTINDHSKQFINEAEHRFTSSVERQKFATAIVNVRSELGQDYPLIIDGQELTTKRSQTSTNPALPEEVIGKISIAGREEAEQAVTAAKQATSDWAATGMAKRSELLSATAELLRQQRDSFAALEILEAGKTWREADANIVEAIDFLEYYAEQAMLLGKGGSNNVPGEENTFLYQPRGVAVIIPPWNFPLAILTGMLSAAIVCGNTAILKPSSETPVIAAKFIQLLHKAGLPKNIVQFLPGPGSDVGEYLVQHPDVNVIAFTGSQIVGTRIIQLASQLAPGQSHIKHVVAEMGGKNAIIIDSDADLDEAVSGTIHSAFSYQGQKCSACSRAIVVGEHYDTFLNRLVEAATSLTIGSPELPGNYLGPVINKSSLERIRQTVSNAKEWADENQTLALDMTITKQKRGHFIGPAIFSHVDPDSPLAQNEIFGPVLSVIKAQNLDEAINIANNSNYALTAGLFSRSPVNIEKVVSELQAGNIYINRGTTGAKVARQPFGGHKLSGPGSKAGGQDYLRHFLTPVTITENTLRRGFAPEISKEVTIV